MISGHSTDANSADAISSAIFALGEEVRYVAVANGQRVELRERPGLADASSPETDRFEELLVNPTLMLLTRQRGDIDCGGFRYLMIRYGYFFQVMIPNPAGGHISVSVEPDYDPVRIAEKAERLINSAAAVG